MRKGGKATVNPQKGKRRSSFSLFPSVPILLFFFLRFRSFLSSSILLLVCFYCWLSPFSSLTLAVAVCGLLCEFTVCHPLQRHFRSLTQGVSESQRVKGDQTRTRRHSSPQREICSSAPLILPGSQSPFPHPFHRRAMHSPHTQHTRLRVAQSLLLFPTLRRRSLPGQMNTPFSLSGGKPHPVNVSAALTLTHVTPTHEKGVWEGFSRSERE